MANCRETQSRTLASIQPRSSFELLASGSETLRDGAATSDRRPLETRVCVCSVDSIAGTQRAPPSLVEGRPCWSLRVIRPTTAEFWNEYVRVQYNTGTQPPVSVPARTRISIHRSPPRRDENASTLAQAALYSRRDVYFGRLEQCACCRLPRISRTEVHYSTVV